MNAFTKNQIETITKMINIFFVVHKGGNDTLYIWVDDKHLPSNFIKFHFIWPSDFRKFIINVRELFGVTNIQICFPNGVENAGLKLLECNENDLEEYKQPFKEWPKALPIFPDMPWLTYGWQYYEALENELWRKIE